MTKIPGEELFTTEPESQREREKERKTTPSLKRILDFAVSLW
jgi:hypothetical protein